MESYQSGKPLCFTIRKKVLAFFLVVIFSSALLVVFPTVANGVNFYLPYEAGKTYKCTADYNWHEKGGHNSKTNDYAYDFGLPNGTPVLASAPGIVADSGKHSSFGYYVLIKMHDGTFMRYAHLQASGYAKKGTTVKQGEPIGKSGNSGVGSGYHLHIERESPQWVGKYFTFVEGEPKNRRMVHLS